MLELPDVRATPAERFRLEMGLPRFRVGLAFIAVNTLAPPVIVRVAGLPAAPGVVVGALVAIVAVGLYLDPSLRMPTSLLISDESIELTRGSRRWASTPAALREHRSVAGVGTLLRAGDLRVVIPERLTTPRQRAELRGWIERGEAVRSSGGVARWNTVSWGSDTETMPHRPSARPALRAAVLVILALGLAAYTFLAAWRSVSDETIASIALAAAVPLAAGLGLLSGELGRLRARPATQSCAVADGAMRLADDTSSMTVPGRYLMSVTRTSGGIDVRYRGGLLCLPRSAFRDKHHRDRFAGALRSLRESSEDGSGGIRG